MRASLLLLASIYQQFASFYQILCQRTFITESCPKANKLTSIPAYQQLLLEASRCNIATFTSVQYHVSIACQMAVSYCVLHLSTQTACPTFAANLSYQNATNESCEHTVAQNYFLPLRVTKHVKDYFIV